MVGGLVSWQRERAAVSSANCQLYQEKPCGWLRFLPMRLFSIYFSLNCLWLLLWSRHSPTPRFLRHFLPTPGTLLPPINYSEACRPGCPIGAGSFQRGRGSKWGKKASLGDALKKKKHADSFCNQNLEKEKEKPGADRKSNWKFWFFFFFKHAHVHTHRWCWGGIAGGAHHHHHHHYCPAFTSLPPYNIARPTML